LGGLGAVALGACTTRVAHVFGAYRFEEGMDPAEDCLEAAAAVDVVDGPDPGICNGVRCWIAPGGNVFVTTTACDAPPDYRDHTSDPAGTACGRAIAVFQRIGTGNCPAQDAGPTGEAGK
jgi:hypothetical protein